MTALQGTTSSHDDFDEPRVFIPGPTAVPRGGWPKLTAAAATTLSKFNPAFVKDMAEGRLSEAEVCRQYKVEWLDWLHLKTTPQWKKALAEHNNDEAVQRLTYKEKCTQLRDSTLPVLAQILMDGDVSPSVRVDAYKVIAAGAGDPVDSNAGRPLFALQINFGDGRAPLTINAEPLPSYDPLEDLG